MARYNRRNTETGRLIKVQQDTHKTLERIIDDVGLRDTLAILAEVCRLKAEHIVVNWQDEGLAAQWDTAAEAIDEVAYGRIIKGL